MTQSRQTVLITGCSDGGMGAALAREFHRAGLDVIATARDVSKMASLSDLPGMRLLALDVQSQSSIAACAAQVLRLDMLVNNAGATYTMPAADVSLSAARSLFDTNVWGCLAVAQAFVPTLMRSERAVIANHTSIGADLVIPMQGVYNASKAAMAMLTETMRVEMQCLGIRVVNLKTGGVETNIMKNAAAKGPALPEGSVYAPAKAEVDRLLRGEWLEARGMGIPAEQWAKEVVGDLLQANPPPIIWRGESAWAASFAALLPRSWFEGMTKRMVGLDKVEHIMQQSRT